MKYSIFIILSFFFILISCSKENSVVSEITDPTPRELTGDSLLAFQMDEIAHPISGSSYLLPDDELSCLSVLGNHQFVGLGEATHGTREFFEMKHRVFKYLVEHYGFRVFAIEADMGESYYINQYIQTGEGNAGDIMRDKMHFWTWCTQEVQDLIEWMKDYNLSASDENKLYYIGIDCQYFDNSTELVSSYLEQYSGKLYARYISCLYELFEVNLGSSSTIQEFYESMGANKFQAMKDSMSTFYNVLENHRDELISASNRYEFEIHKQLVKNILYTHEMFGGRYSGIGSENYRDKHMADDAIWAGNFMGSEFKTVVWAHNGHVVRMAYQHTGSMGYYMDQLVGDRYNVIAFSFSKGSFRAVGMDSAEGYFTHSTSIDPVEGSYQEIFNISRYPDFILVNSEISSDNEFGEWYYEPHLFIAVGSVFTGSIAYYYGNIYDLMTDFDVVIHFNISRASVYIR